MLLLVGIVLILSLTNVLAAENIQRKVTPLVSPKSSKLAAENNKLRFSPPLERLQEKGLTTSTFSGSSVSLFPHPYNMKCRDNLF